MKYQFFEAAGLTVMLRVLCSAWEVWLCVAVCVCVWWIKPQTHQAGIHLSGRSS